MERKLLSYMLALRIEGLCPEMTRARNDKFRIIILVALWSIAMNFFFQNCEICLVMKFSIPKVNAAVMYDYLGNLKLDN